MKHLRQKNAQEINLKHNLRVEKTLIDLEKIKELEKDKKEKIKLLKL